MRSTSKSAFILGLMLLLAVALAAGQSTPTGASAPRGKTIQKRGKVEAGVEGGCLILRDTRDHKLYNLLFRTGKKPQAGEQISFTGIQDDRATTCMEGIPVVVTSWKPENPKSK